MVRIRLTRTGKKNAPSYRVVIVPQREKRESKFIEIIGYFLPKTKVIQINEERAKYWLSVGAQPSDTVRSLMVKQGILEASAVKKTYLKTPGKQSLERAKAKAEKAEKKAE